MPAPTVQPGNRCGTPARGCLATGQTLLDDEILKLVDGFKRFRHEHFHTEDGLYQRLTREGQSPRIMVIACCDARVDPAIITDCDPGDLFVVRNVANLVPPNESGGHYHGTSAALEFAVRGLGVRHVIVLGHARCGGIRALLHDAIGTGESSQFIQPWMTIATKARDTTLQAGLDPLSDAAARQCEQDAVRISLENLLSFPWVAERVRNGDLQLHGWYFDMDGGELLRYDPTAQRFVSLT
jgi:carbonic anhydrase